MLFLIRLVFVCVMLSMSGCYGGTWFSHAQERHQIDQLMGFYQNWKGTRYQWGGTTKAGIDCSALVQHGIASVYDQKLPRTTRQQAKYGSRVIFSREAGDLVFFKINSRIRHVGIYINDGRFLHASVSKGVTISSLDNPYWNKRYWKTTRL